MGEFPQNKGIVIKIEDDGHPIYWLHSIEGSKKYFFYCSAELPLNHYVRVEFVPDIEEFSVIRRYWDYGVPL